MRKYYQKCIKIAKTAFKRLNNTKFLIHIACPPPSTLIHISTFHNNIYIKKKNLVGSQATFLVELLATCRMGLPTTFRMTLLAPSLVRILYICLSGLIATFLTFTLRILLFLAAQSSSRRLVVGKTQIVMKLKNSNGDKPKKLKC